MNKLQKVIIMDNFLNNNNINKNVVEIFIDKKYSSSK